MQYLTVRLAWVEIYIRGQILYLMWFNLEILGF